MSVPLWSGDALLDERPSRSQDYRYRGPIPTVSVYNRAFVSLAPQVMGAKVVYHCPTRDVSGKESVDLLQAKRSRLAFNDTQARYFDRVADIFDEPVPDDVKARLRAIVDAAHIKAGDRVLDVGSGTGVLLPLILDHQPGQVFACDLSREMLRRAESHFGNDVTFYHRDVVELVEELQGLDVVICNACFANFYDPLVALRAMRSLLRPGGRLLITHPMGRAFVAYLMMENPWMVRHELPRADSLLAMLWETGLKLDSYVDLPKLYIATAVRPYEDVTFGPFDRVH